MTPLEQARQRLAAVEAIDPTDPRHTVEDMHTLAMAAAIMAVAALEEPATRPTTPCDTGTGPTAAELASELPGISPAILADLRAREAIGVDRYGGPLRRPWAPAAVEAYQELLDCVAYLLVAPEPDARRLECDAARLAERVGKLAATGEAP